MALQVRVQFPSRIVKSCFTSNMALDFIKNTLYIFNTTTSKCTSVYVGASF